MKNQANCLAEIAMIFIYIYIYICMYLLVRLMFHLASTNALWRLNTAMENGSFIDDK